MNAAISMDVDLSMLNHFVSGLTGALQGQMGDPGDASRLLRTEAGQLAWEISEQLGPSSRAKANKAIDRDLQSQLTIKPAFSTFDDPDRQGYSSTADFTWLTAGPNFLLGINDEDNRLDAGAADAMLMYYGGRKGAPRGKRYVEIGTRAAKNGKHQRLIRLNRIRVSSAAYNAVRRNIKAKIGRLRASFAATAAKLIPKKRIPGWVREQFGAVESAGKTIFNDAGINHPTEPFIEFGSRSKGVAANPVVIQKIHNAINRRKYLIFQKLKKVVEGYKYDWETGRVFKPKAGEEADE